MSDDIETDRRGLLKTLALGAAALGAAGPGLMSSKSAAAALPAPEAAPRSGQTEFDVIIIGGGAAGLVAARELGQRGQKCLILEARSRLGGRTFSTEVFGKRGDVGGQWMHWIQPHAWAEITRYGLGIMESPGGNPESVGVITDGKLKTYTPDESLPLLAQGAMAVFPENQTIFARPFEFPNIDAKLISLDKLSVSDRLRATELQPIQRTMLEAYYSTAISGPIDTASVLEQMHWLARANGDSNLLLRACSQFKLKDGTGALLGKIAADSKAEIRLDSPVSVVEQVGKRVTVQCEDGTSVSAPLCVVAMPMNCWNDIEWKPGLLPGKRAAAKEGHAGSGFELHIKVAGRQGGYLGLGPATAPINIVYTDEIGDTESVMVGMGCAANGLDINDDAQVTRALQMLLPGAKVVESYAYDWNADPFSKGTWCNYRPGMLTTYGQDMRSQEGRLIFAGSDIANGWRGFIDGAIETGFRAAREALDIIIKEQ